VIALRDGAVRRDVRDVYRSVWDEYLAMSRAGLVPWAPVTDEAAERAALAGDPRDRVAGGLVEFAESLDLAPALLVVLADLRALSASDRDLGRYSFVGGASIYPFVWNLLLAARAEGLGGVMTTVAARREEELRALLHVPDPWVVAALVVLGYPVHQPSKLRRRSVAEFATWDHFDGTSLGVDESRAQPDRTETDR
jgi:nitroreductase